MGGSVPANTSTTTTVNQSPWQNPTYQALMLGTDKNPGPITNMLRSNAGYMNAYNSMLAQGLTPMDVVNSGKYNPTAGGEGTSFQEAAEGGIMNVRGMAKGGESTGPKDITKQQATWLEQANARAAAGKKLNPADERKRQQYNNQRTNYTNYQGEQQRTQQARQDILKQSLGQTAFTRVNPETGQFESTNPLFNQTIARIQEAQTLPSQFGQATDAYNKAIAGLGGMTNYTPQQVEAQQIEAANIARGDIRDVNAQMAEVERMQGGPNVRAVKSQAAQMTGPSSWTQEGTAAQYMSPYMQNVVDIQKREANRDFAKQMAQLDARAAQAGAYGGSRSAIERAEARRAQAQRLGDIEAQGLQQAYSQGMGQFSTEQGQGLQAGQANLSAAMQSILANQQAGMTAQQLNQLYGQGGFQAQAANQAAQNQAANNYVQQQLTAQGMNQGMDWNTANQNAQMLMQSRLANQQAALQAAMANQSAGLQANQQNLGAYGLMGNMAQGLGGLGAQQAQTNLANIGALGQGASAYQNLGQQYLNTQAQNAQYAMNFPSMIAGPALNAINAQPSSGGVNTQTGTSSPASWMGRAEGGSVEAHKEWDRATGGKVTKKGIASKG